eukprot:TRINITY_DN501_c0_g1_i2.p1 TRINITY_DN501_c0_g1~~TRINITY_DN501_c0_g1_i2.p1  ORF type:complete len:569 (+),score=139.66 TRINITY_DN501_c0_g1_i2:226-1932(+)
MAPRWANKKKPKVADKEETSTQEATVEEPSNATADGDADELKSVGHEGDKVEEEEEHEEQDGEEDDEDQEGEVDSDEEEEEVDDSDGEEANELPIPLTSGKKQKDFEIFVRDLDREASEDDLKKVFGQVGEIQEIRMPKVFPSDRNKGFAFIRFATVEQAQKALNELKNPQVRSQCCNVSPNQECSTLYLGNICKTWTKEAVKEKLVQYQVENVEEIVITNDPFPRPPGKERGFALLEFSTHQDAMKAYKRLQRRDAVFGCDRSALVAFAIPPAEPSEKDIAKATKVFLENIPKSWNKFKVKEELEKYGKIMSITVSTDMKKKRKLKKPKKKGYGWVSFSSHEEAVACVEGVNGSQLGEGDSKVTASIAKPRKSKLSRFRGGYLVAPKGAKQQSKNVKEKKKTEVSNKKTENAKNRYAKKNERPVGFRKPFRGEGRARDVRTTGYPNDRYGRHLELVHSYIGSSVSSREPVTGVKRPYSALRDVQDYRDPPVRHPRSRLDYDVAADSLYSGRLYGRDLSGGRNPYSAYDSPGVGSAGRPYSSGQIVGDPYSAGYSGGLRASYTRGAYY